MLRGPWLQMLDAVWLSMLLSASAGMLAVSVVAATFYFIRWASALETASESCEALHHHILPGRCISSEAAQPTGQHLGCLGVQSAAEASATLHASMHPAAQHCWGSAGGNAYGPCQDN